jgi:mannose-6-phosphate isomerase-like protein (cupin superfamily)
MKVNQETLKKIADLVLEKIEQRTKEEVVGILNMANYHGFLKSRLPEEFLTSVLSPFGLTTDDVQVEIVEVTKDLSDEVHYHEHAFAYVICMGEKYHVASPKNAKAFLKDHWFPVKDSDIVEIPAGTKHGFTIDEGGALTFLSVQAPPIVGHGKDDYIRTN